MPSPYKIHLFFPGGDPEGVRTIEKSNWSGAGIVVPRALIGEAKHRKEFGRPGVYILVGPPEQSELPTVYVGEGDPIKPRLEQHTAKKDFWTYLVAFTNKDDNVNKAHFQYIESKLITLAAQAKRCVLDNGNLPALPTVSEADAADAEGFLAEMLLCLPVLGLSVFSMPTTQRSGATLLHLSRRGAKAEGTETPDGFLVRAGSRAVKDEAPACQSHLKELRSALVANGVLRADGNNLVFTQDYAFASPSTAAGVVVGSSSNGRVEWKTETGKTLKDLQESHT